MEISRAMKNFQKTCRALWRRLERFVWRQIGPHGNPILAIGIMFAMVAVVLVIVYFSPMHR